MRSAHLAWAFFTPPKTIIQSRIGSRSGAIYGALNVSYNPQSESTGLVVAPFMAP